MPGYTFRMRFTMQDGGELELIAHFIPQDECVALFEALRQAISFEQRAIRIVGRLVPEPRLTAWIGDPDALYTYSGRPNRPAPWPEVVRALRERVALQAGEAFNSVLCNLYRDGRDSMGFHSDAEPELGPQPQIASLSLGATRRFQLRPRRRASDERLDLDLTSGSLLIMRGALQHHYRHGVPKQPAVNAPRINLTFRRIHPSP